VTDAESLTDTEGGAGAESVSNGAGAGVEGAFNSGAGAGVEGAFNSCAGGGVEGVFNSGAGGGAGAGAEGTTGSEGAAEVGRDALLVMRAQLGDRLALEELVGYWHLPLWRYVRAMLGDRARADDVSQEVWARALRALPGLRQPDRFAPWLFTIARRCVQSGLQQGYDDSVVPEPVNADEVTGVLDRAQISEGLAGLPLREREVLILFYLHDLALDDCAQILAVPPGTVKSRLNRARRLLRDQMIEKGYTP
jgi:RNA polymerase sigma factor (sigma-70 family)